MLKIIACPICLTDRMKGQGVVRFGRFSANRKNKEVETFFCLLLLVGIIYRSCIKENFVITQLDTKTVYSFIYG